MPWTQTYAPAGSVALSALVAAAPVVVLLGLLGVFHVRAHLAAIAGLGTSLLIAIAGFHMPAKLAFASAGFGAMYGLFPIGWIVLCAIFVYDVTVHTGQFEVLKHSIAGLADDRRIQAVLIAFSFGAFLEGAAGFGTPVAISAAMLIGLGFKARTAAGLALIGNTAPVAFGALGTPILALAKVTNLPAEQLAMMVGRQLPLFSLIVPFWLIAAMCGFRRMREVWPACLTAGLSFGLVQCLVSNTLGPALVDILASVASILATLALLRFWQPREVWRFDYEVGVSETESEPDFETGGSAPLTSGGRDTKRPPSCSLSLWERAGVRGSRKELSNSGEAIGDSPSPRPSPGGRGGETAPFDRLSTDNRGAERSASESAPRSVAANREGGLAVATNSESGMRTSPTPRPAAVAWMPWMILSVVVFAWGVPEVKSALNRVSSPTVKLIGLDQQVFRAPPVVPKAHPEEAVFSFNWLSATGTALLIAGIASGLLLGLGPATILAIFARTLWRVRLSLLTIAAMLALGFVTRFGGLDSTMGLAFAATGKLFPFFSPLLGWLGVALTGSDTSSNVLFGNLQQVTAGRVGIPPILAAAANSSGGVMGKMIDAQSIVVAGVATNQEGQEGTILRDVFFHSLALAILVGILVIAQAYLFPGIVPK